MGIKETGEKEHCTKCWMDLPVDKGRFISLYEVNTVPHLFKFDENDWLCEECENELMENN